jgi:nucleoside-diphosphate-sugar epimerase
MEHSKPKVVITGISGYLGSHVCNVFLQSGAFHVRGTVRDKSNEKKIQPLKDAFGDHFSALELFEADLLNEASIEKAIEGCAFVVHTASPFPSVAPKDENVLIKPAVEGTLAVMRAAHKHKVKRVVITSSVASIMMGHGDKMCTEDDWSILTECHAYEKSKTMAEKAAWEFINALPEHEKFELVTINPSLILGPNFVVGDFTSGEVIKKILSGKIPGMPVIQFPIVDVRDVALAHFKALTVPEARNQRFICSAESLWFREIAEALKEEFGADYKFNTKELKYCTVKLASIFDGSIKMILPMWKKQLKFNHDKSVRVLGIEYKNTKTTIIEMGHALIKCGIVPDKRKKH